MMLDILNQLPDELWLLIFAYLPKTKHTLAVVRSSRAMHSFGQRCGFLKKIHLNMSAYTRLFLQHMATIDSVHIVSQPNPHNWLLKFPRDIVCKNCTLTEKFLPPGKEVACTEVLRFHNYDKRDRTLFKTDWHRFPRLSRVFITAYGVDTTGLEKLPLTCVFISTHQSYITWCDGRLVFSRYRNDAEYDFLATRFIQ